MIEGIIGVMIGWIFGYSTAYLIYRKVIMKIGAKQEQNKGTKKCQ